MITALRIIDLGVIAEADLPLGPGLTVVTGETGAGKTMLVTALGLLMGGRSDPAAVRRGAKKAIVEGEFLVPADSTDISERIDDAGGEIDDGTLLINRTVPAEGRSRAVAGGRTVPAGTLADVGERLVSVHGQSEQLTLRSPTAQRELLDRFGGEPVGRALSDYALAYREWKDAQATLERLVHTSTQRQEEIDRLRASLEEIAAVRPEPGEDEALAALSRRLGATEELRMAAASAHTALAGDEMGPSAAGLVETAQTALDRALDNDESLAPLVERLADVSYQIADLAAEVSSYATSLDDDAEVDLESTEARRAALGSLAHFGATTDSVLEWERGAAGRLLALENEDESLAGMAEHVSGLESLMRQAASALREERERAARTLESAVTAELKALAMPGAALVIDLGEPGEPSRYGTESARILLSHNGGAGQEIGKTASGGELSRVMLAIEVVLSEVHPVPTFVFDEVDSGVGGRAAVEIGRRLARLAARSQVLVVTHLPQVAAWADTHLSVAKSTHDGTPISGVDVLGDEARVAEIARMLAGHDDSRAALEHAGELVESARAETAVWRSRRVPEPGGV